MPHEGVAWRLAVQGKHPPSVHLRHQQGLSQAGKEELAGRDLRPPGVTQLILSQLPRGASAPAAQR